MSVPVIGAHDARFLCGGPAGPPSEYNTFEEGVAHHAVAAVRPAGDLAAGIEPFQGGLGIRVDRQAAVLVVEHGVGQDRLLERVDPGAAVAPQHVRERDLGVLGRDPRRVEVDGGAAVLGLDALALLDLVEDRLADDVARAERVGELLAVGVQQDGAVGAGRLRDRVALHRLGPRAPVRVVLELVEVARLGAELERDPRHLAGRVRVVRRELAALLAPPGSSGRRQRASTVAASSSCSPQVARQPFSPGSSAESGLFGEQRSAAGLERVAERLRDRVPGAVAHLEQALRGGAAAAGEPVAAVLPRELDPELLEPVDRALRVAREDLDEAHVGAVVRALEDVRGVLLGRVVVPERRLDPALRLRGVARLDRALGGKADAGAGALGRDGRGEPGGAAADHEHVEGCALRHGVRIPEQLMHCISHRY